MKNTILFILIVLFILLVNNHQINSQPINNLASKITVISDLNIPYLTLSGSFEIETELDITRNTPIHTPPRFSKEDVALLSRAIFDPELQLEPWMTNLETDKWIVVNEEKLELEEWMISPTKWLTGKR